VERSCNSMKGTYFVDPYLYFKERLRMKMTILDVK
jgi:hypothetical protein